MTEQQAGVGELTLPRPIRHKVLIDPHYDSDKVGSIILAPSAVNPEAQQGEVLAIGPGQEIVKPGDYIVFKPFTAKTLDWQGHEYLIIDHADIVGWLAPDGELFPLPEFVMVSPDWDDYTGKLILPKETFQDNPRVRGRVLRRGEKVATVKPGDTVYYPSSAGFEVGVKTTVYYLIRESDLLAKV